VANPGAPVRSPLLGSPRFLGRPAAPARALAALAPPAAPAPTLSPRPVRAGAARASAAGPARASELRIGAFNLSIPGAGAAYGRRVAERVTELLARRWPASLGAGRAGGDGGDIGRIDLRVRAGAGGEEALSESIVEAVLGAMQKG